MLGHRTLPSIVSNLHISSLADIASLDIAKLGQYSIINASSSSILAIAVLIPLLQQHL